MHYNLDIKKDRSLDIGRIIIVGINGKSRAMGIEVFGETVNNEGNLVLRRSHGLCSSVQFSLYANRLNKYKQPKHCIQNKSFSLYQGV